MLTATSPIEELAHLATTPAELPPLRWVAESHLDLNLVEPIANMGANKPLGGLWLSPASTHNPRGSAWTDFLESARWNKYTKSNLVCDEVVLQEGARILRIDSYEEFQQILSAYLYMPDWMDNIIEFPQEFFHVFDFEKLAQDWDGIYLSQEGQATTHKAGGADLYGWDLPSLIIFHRATVKTVERKGAYTLKALPQE